MQTLKNILLLLAAVIIFTVLAPFGIITAIVMVIIKDSREQYPKFSSYLFSIAYGIDVLGNIVCGDLFNLTLAKHGGYKFGKIGETISSAIGKNLLQNKLTKTGHLINAFLNLFEDNHAIKAIEK